MAQINWSDQSIQDLINISEFIARDSSKYAIITIRKIRNAALQTSEFPLSGRIVPEINLNEIRELFVGNYRLIYFIASKDRIDILTVYHSSRLLNEEDIKSFRR
jgi:addiction module RelE/StbE family toxin